jgi:hypothetical protein
MQCKEHGFTIAVAPRRGVPGPELVPMSVKTAVVYYSATGSVHPMAEAVVEGEEKAGAEVRLRRAPELAGEDAIDFDTA